MLVILCQGLCWITTCVDRYWLLNEGMPYTVEGTSAFLGFQFFCSMAVAVTVFIKGLLKASVCAFGLGQCGVIFLWLNLMYSAFCANCLELNGLSLSVFTTLGIPNELITLSNTGIVAFADSEKPLRISTTRYLEYSSFITNSAQIEEYHKSLH